MDCRWTPIKGGGFNPQGGAAPKGPFVIDPTKVYPTVPSSAEACPTIKGGNSGMVLYAPIGSGAGKAALLANNPATITGPISASAPPYTSAGTFIRARTAAPGAAPSVNLDRIANYDGLQFIGTDDPISKADVDKLPSKFAGILQFPTAYGMIAIGFNGKDGNGNGLRIVPGNVSNGAAVVGQNIPATAPSSQLKLSRKSICGIFSGRITVWNNPSLQDDNHGTVLGTGKITVVHRSDGSGSTFLLANALITQCADVTGPEEGTGKTVSFAFRYKNRSAACPVGAAAAANLINWPDLKTDQCGKAIPNENNAVFLGANGTSGVVDQVKPTADGAADTNKGSIGYAVQNAWAPFVKGAPAVANLQNNFDARRGNANFVPPSPGGGWLAMDSINPSFANAAERANPVLWTQQANFANPTGPNVYPIGGFTWIATYRCYQKHKNGYDPVSAVTTLVDLLINDPKVRPFLLNDGFGPVQAQWSNQANILLKDGAGGPRDNCGGAFTGAY